MYPCYVLIYVNVSERNLSNACYVFGSGCAAFHSSARMIWKGIGGGVGRWTPSAWNPFSFATYLTTIGVLSGAVYSKVPELMMGESCKLERIPLSSTCIPFAVSKL